MLRHRFALTLVALAVLTIGAFALYGSVYLADYDHHGFQIGCGTGLFADYEQADIASRQGADGKDYVSQCTSATWWRRGWAVPLVLVGLGGAIALQVLTPSPVKPGQPTRR